MNARDLILSLLIGYRRWRGHTARQLPLHGNVMILAPHPDDEVFGCGGAIARLTDSGNQPHVVIMSGGGKSHAGCCGTDSRMIINERRRLAVRSACSLGLSERNLHFLDFTDGDISSRPAKEVEKLREIISQTKPDMILVPHRGEGWPDHLAVRELGLGLAPDGCEVYEYCVWMWYYRQKHLDWTHAYRLRMTPVEHVRKKAAITAYNSASAPCGKPWVGVLPPCFLKANSSDTELYFRIR